MTFEIYEDAAEGWRWRLRARNGRIVADSGEAYRSERNVERAIASIQSFASDVAIATRESDHPHGRSASRAAVYNGAVLIDLAKKGGK